MLDLYEELKAITSLMESENIAYALAGGMAVSLYARPRATEDVDLLVAPEGLPQIAASLSGKRYLPSGGVMHFADGSISIQRYTKIEGKDIMILDLILAESQDLKSILERREALQYEEGTLFIVKPEDLVRLKQLRSSPQDLADIAALQERLGEP